MAATSTRYEPTRGVACAAVEALAGVRHVRADGLAANLQRAEALRHARDLLAGLVVRRLGARVVVREPRAPPVR